MLVFAQMSRLQSVLPFTLLLVLVGCPQKDPASVSSSRSASSPDPVLVLPDAGPRDGSSYTVTPVGERSVDDAATAGLCGCKLCAPVVSADACSTDADCAPSTPCHARECVARSKATPRTSGLKCTMNLVCDSADVNQCGCVNKRCTLSPR